MNNSKTVKIALIQHACGSDRDENVARITTKIRQAAKAGGRLVLLQELHNTPYFCQTEEARIFDLAESIPGPSSEHFTALAAELGVVIVSSLFEKRTAGIYHNTAVVFDSDGRMAGRYRKMHIPDDPGFYEKFYFTPGDLGFKPIDTSLGRLGVLICWDQWYPEAARLMALAGAELLLYPTAIGWDPADSEAEQLRQRDAWITVQRGHAVANGLPVAACNRVGHETDPTGQGRGIRFWGNSFVCGPQGEMLGESGVEEDILLVDIDLGRSETVRRIWPFLRDRRIDNFADLQRRYID